MSTSSVSQSSPRRAGLPLGSFSIYLIVLAIFIVLGLVAWISQLSSGLIVTDMRDVVMWGLYIVGFMVFTGLAAGAMVFSAVPYVFNLEQYKPYAKISAFLALVSTIAAGMFILVDIGVPSRLWHLLAYAQLDSPMLWDVIIITAFLILSTVFLRRLVLLDRGRVSEQSIKPLAYVVLIVGLLDGVTAFVFGLQIGRPFWHSPLQPAAFVVSALVSALAVLILLAVVLRALKSLTFEPKLIERMAGLLGVLLIIDILFLASELITEAFSRSEGGLAIVRLLLSEAGAPAFWLGVFIPSVVALALLLLPMLRRNPQLASVAAILVLVAVFFKKFNLLMAAFTLPLISNPTVETGPASPNMSTFLQAMTDRMGYFPSLTEWGVAAGILAVAILVLSLGLRNLPLRKVNGAD